MMNFARMLLALALLASSICQAQETTQWQQLYQQDWYPSDPELLVETQAYIEHKFPGDNLDSLQYLASSERQRLAHATVLNLRSRVLLEHTPDFQLWAQLIVRIGELEQDYLLQTEGYHFLAENLILQRAQPSQLLEHLRIAEQLLAQNPPPASLAEMAKVLELRALLLRARQKFLAGDFLGQVSLMEQSLRQSNNRADPELTIHLLYLKGVGHYKLVQNELALQALYEALRLEKQTLAHLLLPDLNRYIGLTYLQQNRSELAIDYLQKAIELYQQKKMPRRAALSLRNMGKIYLTSGKPNEALAIFLNALAQEREHQRYKAVAWVELLIAEAYLQLKDAEQAQAYLTEAISYFSESPDASESRGILQAQLMEAQVLAIEGSEQALQQALKRAEQLQESVEQLNSRELLAFSSKVRIQLYTQAGLFEKANQLMALELQQLRTQLSSSVGWRVQQVQDNFQFHEIQTELADANLALDKAKINSDRYQRYATWLLAILLFSGAAALGWRHRFKLLRNDLIRAQVQARQHPATGLANERQMYECIQEQMNSLQGEQEAWYTSTSEDNAPAGKLFIIIRVPLLQTIHEQYGMEAGRRIERKLGQFLRSRFGDDAVFQPKDDLVGLIVPSHQLQLAAQRILNTVRTFAPPGLGPLENLSLGMIQYPFVGRASKTTDFRVVGELLMLAITAASQLSVRHQQQAWVALEAIDAIPLTLFNSRIRDNLLLAIDKGFIKVLTDFDRSEIQWPQQSGREKQAKAKDQQILLEEVD